MEELKKERKTEIRRPRIIRRNAVLVLFHPWRSAAAGAVYPTSISGWFIRPPLSAYVLHWVPAAAAAFLFAKSKGADEIAPLLQGPGYSVQYPNFRLLGRDSFSRNGGAIEQLVATLGDQWDCSASRKRVNRIDRERPATKRKRRWVRFNNSDGGKKETRRTFLFIKRVIRSGDMAAERTFLPFLFVIYFSFRLCLIANSANPGGAGSIFRLRQTMKYRSNAKKKETIVKKPSRIGRLVWSPQVERWKNIKSRYLYIYPIGFFHERRRKKQEDKILKCILYLFIFCILTLFLYIYICSCQSRPGCLFTESRTKRRPTSTRVSICSVSIVVYINPYRSCVAMRGALRFNCCLGSFPIPSSSSSSSRLFPFQFLLLSRRAPLSYADVIEWHTTFLHMFTCAIGAAATAAAAAHLLMSAIIRTCRWTGTKRLITFQLRDLEFSSVRDVTCVGAQAFVVSIRLLLLLLLGAILIKFIAIAVVIHADGESNGILETSRVV